MECLAVRRAGIDFEEWCSLLQIRLLSAGLGGRKLGVRCWVYGFTALFSDVSQLAGVINWALGIGVEDLRICGVSCYQHASSNTHPAIFQRVAG